MAYDKKKVRQVTVYVPHGIVKEMGRFHTERGRPRMSYSAQIVNILQIWYDNRVADEEQKREAESAEDTGTNPPSYKGD